MRFFWKIYYRFKKPASKSEAIIMLARTTGMKMRNFELGTMCCDLRGEAGGYLIPIED